MIKIVFLGPPGAGKGTQAKLLCEHLSLVHIATGDMLRDAVVRNTELGLQADAIMKRGDLVPDELVISMLVERVDQADVKRGYVLDGFPRTLAQARALDKELGPEGIDTVLVLEVPEEELVSRMLSRGRADDTDVTVQNRLQVYHKQTEPLVGFYEQRQLVKRVDGMGEVPVIQGRVALAVPPCSNEGDCSK